MTAPNTAAFERNVAAFANELSETLTTTVSRVHLAYGFVRGRDSIEAVLEFAAHTEDEDSRYVELDNGCWINVLHRLVPNSDDPKIVSTAKYSYACSLGPNQDKDWLLRYDYERWKETYPPSHIHVNAENRAYNDFVKGTRHAKRPLHEVHLPTRRISLEAFIRHLIVEFDVPPVPGKTKAQILGTLDEGEKRFEMNRSDAKGA